MAAPTGGDFREAEDAVRCQAIPYRPYSVSITVAKPGPEAHVYGYVKHPTRPHWRNYHRPIPNGRTFLDLLHERMEATRRDLMELAGVSAVLLGRSPAEAAAR